MAGEQLPLFDRRTTIAAQQLAVLRLVRARPGMTSAELGQIADMLGGDGRFICARRLPELARMGLVVRGAARKCAVNGTKAITWWPEQWNNDD